MSINLKEKHKCSYRIKERILCALIWADPIPFQNSLSFMYFYIARALKSNAHNCRTGVSKIKAWISKNWKNIVIFCSFSPKIKGHQELEQNRNLQIVCINTGIKYVQLKAPAEWVDTAKYFLICAIEIILLIMITTTD